MAANASLDEVPELVAVTTLRVAGELELAELELGALTGSQR
jgi:hypothetical protein